MVREILGRVKSYINSNYGVFLALPLCFALIICTSLILLDKKREVEVRKLLFEESALTDLYRNYVNEKGDNGAKVKEIEETREALLTKARRVDYNYSVFLPHAEKSMLRNMWASARVMDATPNITPNMMKSETDFINAKLKDIKYKLMIFRPSGILISLLRILVLGAFLNIIVLVWTSRTLPNSGDEAFVTIEDDDMNGDDSTNKEDVDKDLRKT